MKISLITNKPSFYQKLKSSYFDDQAIDCTIFNGKWDDNIEVLLIIDPYLVLEEWLQLAELWQKWLLKEGKEVKVLIASFNQQENNPNYIDLLQLPTQLKTTIHQAKPLVEMTIPEVFGISLVGKFRKFLDGHGEESLLKLITQLRSSFDTAIFMLDDGDDFEDAWESMLKVVGEMIGQQLISRWEKYKNYFIPTPFYHSLQSYEGALFKPLLSFYQDNPNEDAMRELTPKLSELSQYLREIDQLLGE